MNHAPHKTRKNYPTINLSHKTNPNLGGSPNFLKFLIWIGGIKPWIFNGYLGNRKYLAPSGDVSYLMVDLEFAEMETSVDVDDFAGAEGEVVLGNGGDGFSDV